MADQILKQGDSFTDPAGRTGTVGFDATTGKPLAPGQTTAITTPTGLSSIAQPPANNGLNASADPQDQKLLAAGVTQQEIDQMKTEKGLDPTSFQSVIQKVQDKFKNDNELMSTRQLLLKGLFDSPLTPDELAKLPQNIQDLYKSGNTDALQLQVRVLNDQISGRAANITNSINTLVSGYQQSVQQAEQDKKDAESSIQNFLQLYGSAAVPFLKAKYPEASSTIDQLSNLNTIAQQKANSSSGSGAITTGTGSGIVAGEKVPAGIASDVEDVLTGRNTLYNIRQTMGRTNAAAQYMAQMRAAIKKIDPNFDFVASDAGGKFVSSTFYQKALSAITSVEPNIDKAIELSNQVSRIGVAALDKILQAGKVQIGDTKVANFHEAQKLIADEIGLALGQGAVSDMKLQLGFDITDPSLSQETFASNLGIVKEFLANRKAALANQRYSSSTVDGTGGSAQIPKGSLSSPDYVEKVLSGQGLKYNDVVNQIPQGEIGVIDNTTGQIGSIPESEFNSSKYTRI